MEPRGSPGPLLLIFKATLEFQRIMAKRGAQFSKNVMIGTWQFSIFRLGFLFEVMTEKK